MILRIIYSVLQIFFFFSNSSISNSIRNNNNNEDDKTVKKTGERYRSVEEEIGGK
jgi:hypothetical protein